MPWRRLARQPGIVACLAALTAFAWVATGCVLFGVLLLVFPVSPFRWPHVVRGFVVTLVFPLFGLAVSAAWVHLLLARRWRRSVDWIDRLGRFVGWLWIVIGLAWTLRSYEILV